MRAAVTLANLRAARVIANSHATAAAFTGAGGRDALVRVVHNGIDPAPFDAVTPADAAATRAALGVPAGAFVVSLFGRFHPWKGQQVLLDALTALPRVHATVRRGAAVRRGSLRVRPSALRPRRSAWRSRAHFPGFRSDVPGADARVGRHRARVGLSRNRSAA